MGGICFLAEESVFIVLGKKMKAFEYYPKEIVAHRKGVCLSPGYFFDNLNASIPAISLSMVYFYHGRGKDYVGIIWPESFLIIPLG